MAEQTPELTPLQKAALAMKVLRARVDELEREASAPIAVVGLGCRFPAGSNNPDQFWDAVRSGRDGSIEVPPDRWDIDSVYDPTPGTAGKMYVRNSCFIEGVDQFDPLFFRISPREAVGIDPQQRLLLEVAWEALEDAGIAAPTLVGSRTGVFLGISTNDYSALLARTAHGSNSNATAGAGNAASVASGRISYTFGFQGPCVAIDTACSSSLVAAHLAVQAIRNGECGLALVAGVNLMLSPEITVNFSLGRMLSPDGHCKTFDAAADGYVRGEGCGVLVLKKLSDALAAGDRVHAVIRGSSINQDGRSAGLTAPNGLAQEAVIRQALANAKLTPDAVDYVEAHGTGTSLGDPIEMHALKAVFGKQRERPLYVGSVKTNIGHAEAASGVAGLIKAVLMLRHQAMPPHLNFERLNPHIDLSGIDIRIPLAGSAMPLSVAGVSSFGFSGTNAHIVLEAAPLQAQSAAVAPNDGAGNTKPQLFLSARTQSTLQALISRYQIMLADPACRFEDVCHTAAVGRAKLAWWVLVDSPENLRTAVPSNAPAPALRTVDGRRIALPTYPFERERYWVDASPAVDTAPQVLTTFKPGTHPLLGRKIRLPHSPQQRWESVISSNVPGLDFLEQHRVNDQAVMPATCFIEMALATHPDCEIIDLRIPVPFLVSSEATRMLQTIREPDGSFRIVSYPLDDDNGEVITHATGRSEPLSAVAPSPSIPPMPDNGVPFEVSHLYKAMEQLGVSHGPAFRLLAEVTRSDGVAYGKLLQAIAAPHLIWAALHPATLDAALQLVAAALPDAGNNQLLPTRFGRIRVVRRPIEPMTVRGTARRNGASVHAEILIEDKHGIAIHITDLQFEGVASSTAHTDPRNGMYRLDWKPRLLLDGLHSPHFLPEVSALVAGLTDESERLGVQHDMVSYAQAGDALESIATAYVVHALRALGMDFRVGTQVTFGALAESLGVAEQHHRLLTRMLGMLEQDGVLAKRGRLWQVAREPQTPAIDEAIATLLRRFPKMSGEIGMVQRCGSALTEVLTDRTDPLTLLFPANDEGAGVFYETSAYAHTVNGLLKVATAQLAASLPPGRALRVLEVGAGTGGATTAVLAGLSDVSYSYVFTDVSPAFLHEALKKFPDQHVTPRLLDIERDPFAQGFAPQGFDLIVAANVLHATRDIGQSLAHVHGLLADGGALLLVESTEPRRWVDILFGLTAGWWRFEDTKLRPAHPLLSHPQWHGVLQDSGFESGEQAGTEVIVARRTINVESTVQGSTWYVGGNDTHGLRTALEQSGHRCTPQDEAAHWVINVGPVAVDPQAQSGFLQNLIELVQVALTQYEPPTISLIASSALGHAGLPGFVRSLAIEHPALKPRLLLDPAGTVSLVDELIAGGTEPEVRWSKGVRQVARIEVQAANAVLPTAISGTWLITGGYGGLGQETARWLVAQGATRILLLGRRKPTALPDLGIPVDAHEGDAADEALLSRMLQDVNDLQGAVHAAGALSDAPMLEQIEQTIHAVLHPKIAGALALDRAVHGKPLKHFVLFASAAGIVGSANQVNHAFCSTFLDALAHSRRLEGLPGLSLDWGVWSTVGAAARKGFDMQAEQLGLGSITPQQGTDAFGAALGVEAGQLLVLPSVDWQRFTGHLGSTCSPLYESVLTGIAAQQETPVIHPPSRAALSRNDAADALARVVGALLSLPRDFDREVPLSELGLDSLVAVEIKNQVLRELGVELSVRELIEGATLGDLAQRVADSGDQEAPAMQAMLKPDLANRYQPFPLTDMQQAFWVGRRADLALGGVNCYLYTEFDTRVVDIARLERAWNTMVRRHDMLRVVIQADGMQRILPETPPYRFAICDLRQQSPMQVQSELSNLRTSLAKRVTEPGTWPLFDIRVTQFEDLTRLHIGFDLIALDAASIFALRQELGQLYDDPATELAPIGLSFRDYVLHLEAARSTPEWRHSEQYWKARAPSLPDAPELPLAAAPANATAGSQHKPADFKRHLVRVDADSTETLRRHAQSRGLTLPSVLAAAYADVLTMWSRTAQFCITVTLFNRPPLHPDMASLMGDFTSTLLLEVDARAASFTDRALTLMRRMASDIDHADLNGIQVLREVARQNGQGLRTIPVVFTSTLGFRRPSADRVSSEGTLWDRLGTTVYNVSSTPQIWIDHQISEEDGNLLCHWDVLQGVFPAGVVDDMMLAYRKILDALVEGSGWDRPISAAILASAQREAIQAVAPAECLHSAFERQATLTPERVALITHDETLDYATLDLAAAHLAEHLSAQLGDPGKARDRLVAVCFSKGWRQVVAVLAILKAGAAYLPVDPTLPAERRRLLIEQGEALTLGDHRLLDQVLASARARVPAPPPVPAFNDSNRLAYVIYTSGSTGTPKGVMIEHAAAWTTVCEINRRWKVGPDDSVLGLSALSFDLSVYDIFGPLSVGGALVLPEPEAARDPSRWSALLCEHRVTVWNTVPALMAMQVAYGLPAAHALRLVMLSGDWVPLDLVAQLKLLTPKTALVALGGATEAGIWSNAHEIGELDPSWPSIPYGQALAGHQLHVVNAHGEDCPDWASGQIEISGQGLARGYWRDPVRTAERFRIHQATGERRYVTGDLGRFRPYGTKSTVTVPIEFLGREDTQVKIQGHRIELGEIEAALESHPLVANAVATAYAARENLPKILHAFFVPKQLSGKRGEPDWMALVEAGHLAAVSGAETIDDATFNAVAEVTTAHTVSAAAAALRSLAGSGQPLDAHRLISTSGVASRYQHWLKRMLPLVESAVQSEAPTSIEGIAQLDRFGFGAADFELLSEVARRLPDILTERMHSSDIYLSQQTPQVYAKLFEEPNAIIEKLVQHLAANSTVSVPLSILEVGGGLGTTLAAIAPSLPANRVRYHFTDVSPHMVRRARETFGALPWLSFNTLDFDRNPAETVEAGSYDVIIASSALHAAADVQRTLAHLKSLLKPAGVLIALEQTRFFPWFDLSMGLQAGFDSRTDLELRPTHPLLSRDAWHQVCKSTGFTDTDTFVVANSLADRLGVDVFVARAPTAAHATGHPIPLQDAGALEEQLGAWLQQRLPSYMLPKTISVIERMPLSANGKVDRSRLDRLLRERESTGNSPSSAQHGMERDVASLVQELLPAAMTETERSLFELGATSLTLVSLHRLIADRLGRVIPLQAMFERPTIASLARALSELPGPNSHRSAASSKVAEDAPQELLNDPQSRDAWEQARDAIRHAAVFNEVKAETPRTSPQPHDASPFVSFDRQPGGAELRPILIMMPGVLALPFYLRGLSAALSSDVALTTMQFPGMFDDQQPLDSVEAQAEYAVKHLRQFQPSGPYLLAGHSYGGYVAIEMARRLREAGESVPLLILGDSVRTHSSLDAFQTDEVAYVAMTRALYALYGPHLTQPYDAVKALGARAGFDTTAAMVEAAGLFGTTGLPFDRMAAIFKANFKALGSYRPAAIPGDVTVVRTEGGYPPEFHDYESGDSLNDEGLGWTPLVLGKLDVHRMPGDHLSMQDEANMTAFADILRKLVLEVKASELREKQV